MQFAAEGNPISECAAYWSHHLAAIATEGIATQAYAKREGLAAASLYYWRKRLNAANSKDPVLPGGRFLAVQWPQRNEDSGCQLRIGTGVQLNLPQLPSPHWLAALCLALTTQAH